jgi:uncharacterized protein YndB with AHSA1/START domain
MGLTVSHLSVRRAAFIRARPASVWYEFDSFSRLAAWFGTGHQLEVFEPGPNGRIELSVDDGGDRLAFGGDTVIWEPGLEFSFEDNWFGSQAWPVPTFVTLRLQALFDGTQVELIHHGFERLGDAAAATFEGYEAGWDNHHLAALRKIVEE